MGAAVSIAFAICFFVLTGVGETLRQGVFALGPAEITNFMYAALALAALFMLRGDILSVFVRPKAELYGQADLGWSWPRTALALIIAPVLCILPFGFGLALIQINVVSLDALRLIELFAGQALLVALAQELFLRETVLKAFGASVAMMFLVTALTTFIFHLPQGGSYAMMASGAGVFYMSLRLLGANILVVAAIHAGISVVLTHVIVPDLNISEIWPYAIYFTVGAVALALTAYILFAQTRREPRYA